MTGMRKGTPCGCNSDPCGCSSGKAKCIKAISNVSPDPNGDFIFEAGNGIAVTEVQYGIRIDNLTDPDSLIAGTNIVLTQVGNQLEISVSDDINIGNLNVAGDIIQQGSSYETHAEQIYTTDDYIIMRDGAVGGLASGSYSGFQVKKYDGTNDGRLVIDNTGTARVGDVGDEQPLLTRAETGSLTDKRLLVWDGANSKAITQSTTKTDIALNQFGFTYGWAIKYQIAPNIFVYSIYDTFATSTGKVYIDTTVKSLIPFSSISNGSNNTQTISAIIGCDIDGVYINTLQANEWLKGEIVIILT